MAAVREEADVPPPGMRLKLAPGAPQHPQSDLLFQVSHHFLEEAHLLSHGMQLEFLSVMIVETIRVGAAERALRPASRASGRQRQAMSRRAIAVATGLPRETVRRRIKRLVELGVLHEDPNGALSVVPLDDTELGSSLQRHLANHVSMTNSLIQAGLIGICPPGQSAIRG